MIQTSTAVAPQIGRPIVEAKVGLVDIFTKAGTSDPTAAATAIWTASPCAELVAGDEVPDEQWAALVAAATVAIDEGAES